MQFTPLDKKARAEWCEMLKPAGGARLGAAAALFLLSALVLPLSYIEAAAGLYLLYAVFFYYMLTHSIPLILAIGAPAMLLFAASAYATGLPHPYLMPAVYTALVLGSAGGAFLVVNCRERKHLGFLALPVAAYAVAAVVAGPLRAFFVLIPLAIALILGFGIRQCRPQTPVLLCAAGVLALSGVVTYLIWYARIGWPVGNPVAYLADLVRAGVTHAAQDTLALYEEMGMEMMLLGDVKNVGIVVANVLPGFFLMGCSILAFLAYRTHLRLLSAWGTLSRVPLRIGAMTVSPMAAVLFLVSYLVGMVAAPGVLGAVCENISIVLEPALVLVGGTSLFSRGREKRSVLSTVLLLGMLVVLFNFPALALTLTAFLGAIRILLAAWATRKKKDIK